MTDACLSRHLADGIATLTLNRPDKSNAFDQDMWRALREALQWADDTPEVRVVLLTGAGKNFCAGIDLAMLLNIQQAIHQECEGRKREALRRLILQLQDDISSLERCRKPVIAAIHGACIGGGIDLVTAADIRFASTDAYFAVR